MKSIRVSSTTLFPTFRKFDASSPNARLHVVSGPSLSGKSTLILNSAQQYDSVLFSDRRSLRGMRPGGHYALHYNIIRPFWYRFGRPWWTSLRRTARRALRCRSVAFSNPYMQDPMLKAVRHSRLEVHATILVVSRAVLLERLTQYATVAQIPGEPGRRYPRQEWWQAFQSLDLGDLYRKWIEFLEMNHISYRLVDSSNDHYQPIARDELGDVLANHTAARRDDFTG